ncbi:MAG: nucleotide-binding protein [Dehalococcoidales bacterium]|nr:nucleotide-binding protein [Dehalococcoidales bacterium]
MIVDELKDFRTKLMQYAAYRKRQIVDRKELTRKEDPNLESLYDELSISVGKYTALIKEYTGLETIHTSAGLQDVWNWAFSFEANSLVVNALDNCIQATGRTIGELEEDIKKGKRDEQGDLIEEPPTIDTKPPKAFIAHEGETEQLKKLKDFLDALGIEYLIAETQASDGRSIEGQVDWTQGSADFAICLATKGKAINKKTGKHYMALNIADELGRARQVFRNRIILLVQKGIEVHTNTREIVYAPFTTQNMDIAFTKIVKELRNWGYIRAVRIKE